MSMPRLGLFWPPDDVDLGDGTPAMDRMAVRTGVPHAEYHPDAVEARVAVYTALHPNSEIILRVDYGETWAIPTVDQMADWWERAAWAIHRDTYRKLAACGLLLIQLWNEPQLEFPPDADHSIDSLYCADAYNGRRFPHPWGDNFRDLVAAWVPGARTLPTPIAPYHDDNLFAGAAPEGLEDTPWARLHYHHHARMQANGPIDAVNEHGYGDPDPGDPGRLEGATDHTIAENGGRFALNVFRTWRASHDLNGFALPVYVTEINTAARWVEGNIETTPAGNYPNEWLISAVLAAGAILGDVRAVLWFVGHARSPMWTDFALDGDHGRLPALRADWDWLKAHGW